MWEWLRDLLASCIDYLMPFVIVKAHEEAVLLSWGKYHLTRKPGTYMKWPVRDYYYHVSVKADTISIDEVNITTSDGQTISIGCVVEFEIENAYKFLIETNDAHSNMKDVCRGVLSSTLEEVGWEEIKKKPVMNRVTNKLKSKYTPMGVVVNDVMFTDKCKTFAFKVFHNRSNPDISVTHI